MGAPEDRPSRGDRRRAASAIRRACAQGRIVEADRDLRLAQVDDAGTGAELAALLRGLEPDAAWSGPAAVPSSPTAQAPTPVTPARSSVLPAVVIGMVAALVVAVGAIVVTVLASGVGSAGRTTYATPAPPLATSANMLDPETLDAFLAGLRERTDQGKVYDVVVYPGYAVARGPGRDGRDHVYRYAGELVDIVTSTRSSGVQRTVDVRGVRAEVVLGVLATARRRIDPSPTSQYVRFAPGTGAGADADAVLRAYVGGGFVTATREGRIVRVVGARDTTTDGQA